MLIDAHTHVNFKAFAEDVGEVIERALSQEIWLVNIGTQSDTSRAAVELAEKYEQGVYASVGLHPIHLFSQHVDEEETGFQTREEEFNVAYYRELAKSEKVVAIGETGLDYYRLPVGEDQELIKKKQQTVFRQQLYLARELDLPLSIHCRDAYVDLAHILKEENFTNAVMHCFTGTWQEAQMFLDLGFYLSFSGIITFGKSANVLKEVVRQTPLDRLIIETDAPYLSPVPYRGQRNEPSYVKFVAEAVAELKNLSMHTVAEATLTNTRKLFKI